MHPTNKPTKEVHMLIKTTIALAMALALGVTSAALAAKGGGSGRDGSIEFGVPGQTASSGVNQAEHRSLGGKKAEEMIMSDGKCWTNYSWGKCRR
jgi:hypothetical protein